MLDKVMASISIVLFIGFLAIVVVFVNEVDLTIVIVGVLMLAVYDFWRSNRNDNEESAGKD